MYCQTGFRTSCCHEDCPATQHTFRRLMGRSVDERLAEQLKGLPADKQLHMAEGRPASAQPAI